MKTSFLSAKSYFSIALFLILVSSSIAQSSYYWYGNAPDGNWRQGAGGARWTGGLWNEPPTSAGSILRFDNNGWLDMTNNVPSTYEIHKIIFMVTASSNRTINGSNSVKFFEYGATWPVIRNESTALHTINFPVIASTNSGFNLELDANSGALAFGGGITNSGRTICVYGNNSAIDANVRYVKFNSAISGMGVLKVTNFGTAKLAAVQTYTGETQVDKGELWIEENGSINASSVIYVGNGAMLADVAKFFISDLNGGTTVANNININAGNTSTRFVGSLNSSGTNIFSGNIVRSSSQPLTIEVTSSGGNVDFQGVINGSGTLTKIGSGTATLKGANTFTGALTVSAGTLTLDNSANSTLAASVDVTVSGGTLLVNRNQTINSLSISSGASVIVSSGVTLTVSGTITNNGTFDIQSGGQLLQGSSTDVSGSGTCIFRKSLPQVTNTALSGFNRSYYIGSPVVGASSTTPVSIVSVLGSSTTGLNMYGYTETNNSWPLYYSGTLQSQGSTFDIGKGYFVNSSSGTYFSQANFTGNSFNNGDVTVTLTNTAGQGGGYNLISNPYPSGIDWSSIYGDASNTSLVGSSYWLRTYDTGGAGMVYKTCNASGVSTQGINTTISPATGFWVKYIGTSPGTFTFKNAMRTSGAGTYYTMNANHIIRLDLGNGSYNDQAVVYMNEDAGLGIESYDSDKRIPSTTVHQLYSLEGATKLAINGFNNALAKDTVLLGMQIPTAGTYSINASQIDATIEEDVFLEDKITGAYQNLKITPSYTFTSTQGTFNNRFVLHFAPFVPALPGQTAATAIAMPTSNWPQCNNVSTEDQWHAFTATSEGISIEVNTASTDIVIELQDGTGNAVAQENAVNGIGNETLNFFGLTAGQTYKVGVRNNISSQPTGTYGICVKSLKRGGCDYGAGPYSLCQYYKATWAGSTGVSYTFTFTGTSGPAAGQTFTRTQNSDICVLSTVTPLLPYGSTYDVVISNTYTLTDGAGNTEQVTVPSNSGCQVVTIAQPQTTLSASSSCNNGARFRGAVVSSMPWVCGANNWRWRFTEVNPLTMQTVGLPIELNRGTASNYLSFASVAQLQNGKTYAVETAPMFSYTGTNYQWGPTQYLCIVGAANVTQDVAQDALQDPSEDASQEVSQGVLQGSTKDVAQDAAQDLNAMVYVTEGNHVNIQLTNTESNTAKRADIYDVTGKLVKSVRLVEGMNEVTLTETAGIYMVRTTVGNQSETARVFVNN